MVIIIQINDYVTRKSYNNDIVFKIVDINDTTIILKGAYQRLVADAPINDLIIVESNTINLLNNKEEKKIQSLYSSYNKRSVHMTGKILHIDSDKQYLDKCVALYKNMHIPAYGVHMQEEKIKDNILDLIYQTDPDIIVLTGHDSYNKKGIKDLDNYLTTNDFISAVKEIRRHYSKDHMFIFAGACQSNFEALLAAGCNFASSPKRLNIDIYDPALVAIKAAVTPFNNIIDVSNLSKNISLDRSILSGIESYGKMRLLL